jgi:hypothetical protein
VLGDPAMDMIEIARRIDEFETAAASVSPLAGIGAGAVTQVTCGQNIGLRLLSLRSRI